MATDVLETAAARSASLCASQWKGSRFGRLQVFFQVLAQYGRGGGLKMWAEQAKRS